MPCRCGYYSLGTAQYLRGSRRRGEVLNLSIRSPFWFTRSDNSALLSLRIAAAIKQVFYRPRKQRYILYAASVKVGSFETFAASRPNVGNGVKGRLCADVLVIPIM